MKLSHIAAMFLLAAATAGAAETAGAGKTTPGGSVGVYDSRVLAYAHFWSEPARQQRDDLVARARAAQNAGDAAARSELERQIADAQKRNHLQVFSSAPADEAMAALGPRLPALLPELGVERLISKWDAKALSGIPVERQVDVTDRLARELFTPTDKQRATIDSLKAAKPVSLWRMKLLNAFGHG